MTFGGPLSQTSRRAASLGVRILRQQSGTTRAGNFSIHLENWIIKIVVHTEYSSYIGFIGVVIGEQMVEGVDAVTGIPLGIQELSVTTSRSC